MPFKVACPHCAATLRIPDNAAGKSLRCRKCQQPFAAPAAESLAFNFDQADDPAQQPSVSSRPRPRGDSGWPRAIVIIAAMMRTIGWSMCAGWTLLIGYYYIKSTQQPGFVAGLAAESCFYVIGGYVLTRAGDFVVRQLETIVAGRPGD